MKISIENGLPSVFTERFALKNVNPKLFYPGKTYNVLEVTRKGEWHIEGGQNAARVFCDNFSLYFKEESDSLFFYGEYINDTESVVEGVSSFDPLNCEWDNEIRSAFCNVPVGYNGSVFADMESPIKKQRLILGENVSGADFILFDDDKGNTVSFGACTFNEYFTVLNVNERGYLTASVMTEAENVKPRGKIRSDLFCIHSSGGGFYEAMKKYTGIVAERTRARHVKKPFCGFCTWYYYGPNISEESVLKDLERVAATKEIPYKLFQIDDGWFKKRGDFTENDKFSSMKTLADKIKAKGFIPGIWVSPHAVAEDSDIFVNHKDWLVKNGNGEVHPARALDFSHPQAKKWLKDLFVKLTAEWGYKYIKVDLIAPVMCAGRYYDPSFNSLKNYRESMRIIREAVGEDVFILACTAPLMASVGLADGIRTSVDIFENYDSLLRVFGRSLNRTYLSDGLLTNDTDCILIRKSGNEDEECFRNCVRTDREIEAYLTAFAASGSPMIHSDKLSLLSAEQIKLLSYLSPLSEKAECPYFMNQTIPCVLDFGRRGNFEILAFINWGEKKENFTVYKKGFVFEFWRKEFYGYSDGSMTVEVLPHEAKLFTVGNGNGVFPVGADDTLIPSLTWAYDKDGTLKIYPIKPSEGIYVYSDGEIKASAACEKISEGVYLIKNEKNSSEVIAVKRTSGV